jgi:hypothetical protein
VDAVMNIRVCATDLLTLLLLLTLFELSLRFGIALLHYPGRNGFAEET